MHRPIRFKDLSLFFPHKICFEEFNTQVHYGDRIAIIGCNGSGKSTLLNILQGTITPSEGNIFLPNDVAIGYVPQLIETHQTHSGGERFQHALTHALNQNPNLLLLDEPTNHLDQTNRKSLMRMLQFFPGTLIVVSHDVELLRNNIHIFWHIDDGEVHVFFGNYDDYQKTRQQQREAIADEISLLARSKKHMHESLMKEQQRASKSQAKGKKSIDQRKWPTIVSNAKIARASATTGRKKAHIHEKKTQLTEQLSALRLPEIIIPKFSLTAEDIGEKTLIYINDGSVGYGDKHLIQDIRFHLNSHDHVAIDGKNGSGKTTLIKAILNDPGVVKSGEWVLPRREDIGYLDQHYQNFDPQLTVYEVIGKLATHKNHAEIRTHLNDFLFRKNEEVNALVSTLSGGEKARLSLAQIAIQTPRLLILDELTNNLDLETRQHVIQVLQKFPGALLLISHDENFLQEVGVNDKYEVQNAQLNIQI